MSYEGGRKLDLVELGENLHTNKGESENGTIVKGQKGLLDGGKNGVGQDIRDSCKGMMRAGVVGELNQPQQSPQGGGAAVCWERFLHLRSIRVLLVENDDSTRYVVAALLRNCSYEVVEASNGLQAWRILQDPTNRIDVVLTEVVMPCLSGIGLLCKIVCHKTRNNVPVIMMSSHDSMGLVFKCLSKGAVDFLLKPIRKNELKNLWQHVWRRCHSSSSSGSESGTNTVKSVKSKSAEKSDNNYGSSNEGNNGSPIFNFGDGSDHGSGTQSSWTKQAAEDQVDSPRMASPQDSTCAQVINLNAKPSGSNSLVMATTKECHEQKDQPETDKLEKVMDTGTLRDKDIQPKFQAQVPAELTSTNQRSAPLPNSSYYSEQLAKIATELDETKDLGVLKNISTRSPINDMVFDDRRKQQSVDKGVKRNRGVQDTGNEIQDDRYVLRRSEASAFSRYNAVSHDKVSTGDAQSLTPNENGPDKRGNLRQNIQSHSGSNAPNQCSNGRSVYVDMTSSSNNRLSEAIMLEDKTNETLPTKSSHPSAFRAAKSNRVSSSHNVMVKETHDATAVKMIAPPESPVQEFQVQGGHNIQPQQHPSKLENSLIKKMAKPIPHCGSSTALGGNLDGNGGNCSVNGSASGSNYGSNGPNGSCSGANAGGLNMESDTGVGGKCGSGDGSGSGSGSRSGSGDGTRSGNGGKTDQIKLSQREVALTKFRQKRMERCFKRKVRYQSRKKLAEQRPRVRGQFVRHAPSKSTEDKDS